MLKSNPKDISFEQLMQQAAQVAKAQDSILLEKAKERKRQEEERQEKELRDRLEKQKKERALLAKHQEIEARHRQLLQQKQRPVRKPPRTDTKTVAPKSKKKTTGPAVPVFEKKKPVHLSYEQLMAKAKEVSTPKQASTPISRKEATVDRQTNDINGKSIPSLYPKRPGTINKSKQLSDVNSPIRSLSNTRPKRIDDKVNIKSTQTYRSESSSRKQLQTDRPLIRMPFRRAMDPKKGRRPNELSSSYTHSDEDDDLDSFIVQDNDDDDGSTYDRHIDNDYSSEISKIFRYDRKRYANESVYSDDDMEANPMDVIREEKRSERLARREDQLEEQLELERRKKRLAKSKGK